METLSEEELKEKIIVQATVLEYHPPHDKTDTYLKKKKLGPFDIELEETEATLPVELISLEIDSPEERKGDTIYVSKFTTKDEKALDLEVGDKVEIRASLLFFQIVYEAPMVFETFDNFKVINSNKTRDQISGTRGASD
jgi:hypothetical protein